MKGAPAIARDLERLQEEGFTVHQLSDWHYRLMKDGKTVDFWPSKGTFRGARISGHGVDSLLAQFKGDEVPFTFFGSAGEDVPTRVVEQSALGTVVEAGEFPSPSPTSCPQESALFFQVVRVLMHLRKGEITGTTPLAEAELRRLRRECIAVTKDPAENFDGYLDLFDPVKKEEEVRQHSGGDGARQRFTGVGL